MQYQWEFHDFLDEKELRNYVSTILTSTVNFLFLKNIEKETFENLGKKYARSENYPNGAANEINGEIWKENFLSSHTMTTTNLLKFSY